MNNGLNIYNYYIEQCKNPNYVEEYQSTSDKMSGKTFWHINVNFRSLYAFIDTFQKFVKYDNKDRTTWEVYSNNEQKAKHWTVRMQQSKLFRLNKGVYALTAKGKAFLDFVAILNDPKCIITKEEQWIIIYNFVLNAYFNLKPNYIIKRTLEVFEIFKDSNIDPNHVIASFKELLRKKDITKEELFKTDAFWLLTFLKDKDFLSLYKTATIEEKEKLANHVIAMSIGDRDQIKARNDLISWKFVNSGQYSVNTFLDDVKTLYLTYLVLKKNNTDSLSLIDNINLIMSEIYTIDSKKIKEFIKLHQDVFDVIFDEAILNKNIDTEINNEEETVDTEDEEQEPTGEKLDDTTSKTGHQLRKTSQILKRMAKDRADNRCELESINSCRYFTSKESGKNYLEIHHLIPFEFSNDFEASLEIIDNYVALCPHCHRLIHFGVDRERKGVLTYLYNQRKDALKNKGLNITLKQLFAYYGVNE